MVEIYWLYFPFIIFTARVKENKLSIMYLSLKILKIMTKLNIPTKYRKEMMEMFCIYVKSTSICKSWKTGMVPIKSAQTLL